MELSRMTRNLEVLRRNYTEAERLYEDATTLSSELKISHTQEHEVRNRLGRLKTWLDTLARQFGSDSPSSESS